ncbi:MAG: FAD:protein FMN transferase [Sulfurisoma sp.]|nr:FAD:protein FMN transferase [Sulfurisoma sp.]
MPSRLAAAFAVLLLLAGCGRESLHSQESFVFGTRVEVLVWGGDEARARAATAEVLREFDRLHRAYHAWQPSELTALNDAIAAGRPHEVSAELAALIIEAQAMAKQGEYLFDPGIGALVKLWGFHDDTFKPQLPDAEKLAALKKVRPSIARLTLQDRRVASADFFVALDFGGYLKGVALDRASAIIKATGINNALINIGGNVMALGSKGGTPWRVGIQHPRASTPLATLDLKDGEAIGTSGDYQRYFELDGRRYSHVLDPRTAEPAVGTQALTVLIAPREQAGLWSDVASKPLFVAGDDWRRLAGKFGITQVLRVDAAGRIEITEALRPRLKFEGGVPP